MSQLHLILHRSWDDPDTHVTVGTPAYPFVDGTLLLRPMRVETY